MKNIPKYENVLTVVVSLLYKYGEREREREREKNFYYFFLSIPMKYQMWNSVVDPEQLK